MSCLEKRHIIIRLIFLLQNTFERHDKLAASYCNSSRCQDMYLQQTQIYLHCHKSLCVLSFLYRYMYIMQCMYLEHRQPLWECHHFHDRFHHSECVCWQTQHTHQRVEPPLVALEVDIWLKIFSHIFKANTCTVTKLIGNITCLNFIIQNAFADRHSKLSKLGCLLLQFMTGNPFAIQQL